MTWGEGVMPAAPDQEDITVSQCRRIPVLGQQQPQQRELPWLPLALPAFTGQGGQGSEMPFAMLGCPVAFLFRARSLPLPPPGGISLAVTHKLKGLDASAWSSWAISASCPHSGPPPFP